MIYVGINVTKVKHDCCILGSDGEILFSLFTIQNTLQGFDELTSYVINPLHTNLFRKVRALERRKRIKLMLLQLL